MLNRLVFCKSMATILQGQFWDKFFKKTKQKQQQEKIFGEKKLYFQRPRFLGVSAEDQIEKQYNRKQFTLTYTKARFISTSGGVMLNVTAPLGVYELRWYVGNTSMESTLCNCNISIWKEQIAEVHTLLNNFNI